MSVSDPASPNTTSESDIGGNPRTLLYVKLRQATPRHLHPWVFRRTIRDTPRGARDGDIVEVLGADGTPLGRGFYHGRSSIAVRILTRDPACFLDRKDLRAALGRAISLRRETLRLDRRTDAYRLVHSEGDGLSGLIVDRYAELIVVEFFSKGFFIRREMIRELLLEEYPGSTIVFRVPDLVAARESIHWRPEAEGAQGPEEIEIREGKMRFLVHSGGHKTGFFLDQREHRERLATMVRGKRVLDTFAYTGAFAIAARTLGKARHVTALDLDEKAVAQGKRNSELNRTSIEWLHEDAFPYLRNQRHAANPFDVIIVDPPKWVSDVSEFERAERKYLDINTYAMRAVAPGGLIVTSSCSGRVSEPHFLRILHEAAGLAERRLSIITIGGAGPDHPVDIHCPESRYLKTVFARVDR